MGHSYTGHNCTGRNCTGTRRFIGFDTEAVVDECPPDFKLSRFPQYTAAKAVADDLGIDTPLRKICVYGNCREGWEFLDVEQVGHDYIRHNYV